MTYVVSISLTDSDGDTNSAPFYLDTTYTLAEYEGFGQQIAALVDSTSDSKIDAINLTLSIALPGGLKANAVANSENQKGANLAFNTATRYKHTLRIPALTPAKFSGKSVNTSDADVTALVNAMTAGLTVSGTDMFPRDPYGNDIVSLATAVKSFRRK